MTKIDATSKLHKIKNQRTHLTIWRGNWKRTKKDSCYNKKSVVFSCPGRSIPTRGRRLHRHCRVLDRKSDFGDSRHFRHIIEKDKKRKRQKLKKTKTRKKEFKLWITTFMRFYAIKIIHIKSLDFNNFCFLKERGNYCLYHYM